MGIPATLQDAGGTNALDNTMGAMLLGVIISAVLFGVSIVQMLYYYSRYPKDPAYLKSLVGVVVLLDVIHFALVTHTVYHYLISSYYNHAALNIMVWSVLVEVLPTGVGGALVQSFYAWRVWQMSRGNIPLTVIILVLVVAGAGSGTAWLILSLQQGTYENLLRLSSLTMSINVISAAVDIIIAASLCIMLHRSRRGFKRSDTLINRLILFVVNTGLLTSLCAVGALVSLIASPNSLIYAAFYFCIGRLYTNSLLAALNARNIIRGHSGDSRDMDHVMVSFPPGGITRTPVVDSGRTRHESKITQSVSIRVDTHQSQEYEQELNPMGAKLEFGSGKLKPSGKV